MSALWGLVQAHIDATGLSERAVARAAGLTPQALNGWKHRALRSLPHPENLRAIADVIGTSYEQVLGAALEDADYLRPGEFPERSRPESRSTHEGPTDPTVRRALQIISGALAERER